MYVDLSAAVVTLHKTQFEAWDKWATSLLEQSKHSRIQQ